MSEQTDPAPNDAPTDDMNALGELMYGTAPWATYQHLEVIDKHLGGRPDTHRRAEVLGYAREHLWDGALIDVELTVAEKAIEGISSDTHTAADMEDNGVRVHETLGILSGLAQSSERLEEGTYQRALSLIGQIQERRPGQHYSLKTAVFGRDVIEPKNPVDGIRRPRLRKLAGMAVQGIETAVDRLDRKGRFNRWLDETEREEQRTRYRIHATDVSSVAVAFLDRAAVELEDPEDLADVFPDGLHRAYLDQAAYLRGMYPGDQAEAQDRIDSLVGKALRHVDVDTPDAVDTLLGIYHDKEGLHYTYRANQLERAVQLTEQSSREPVIKKTPRTGFGFLRSVITTDSPFQARRRVITEDALDNFTGYLESQPEHIVRVFFELYGGKLERDEIKEREEAWDQAAELVANHGFVNGHYTSEGIRLTRATLERFEGVAPRGVVQDARERVKERLKTAGPRFY